MNSNKKKVKALIGSLLANDDAKVESLVRELSESIVPNRDEIIIRSLFSQMKNDPEV